MFKRDSLIDELFQSTQSNKTKLALAEHNRSITYEELWKNISLTAAKLSSLGIKKGDRLLFSINNSIDFIVLHFAVLKMGAVSVPVDVSISDINLNLIIDELDPAHIISDRDLSEITKVKMVSFSHHEDLKITNEEINKYQLEPNYLNPTNKEDLSAILYTSGSTGVPKGVMLSNKNTLLTIGNIIEFCEYDSTSFELITLPLTHSFGLGQVYSMLFSGGSAYIEMGMLRMKRIFQAMDKYSITGFPTTPKGVDLILSRYSEIFKSKGRDLTGMIINSAPLSPYQTKELQRLLPHISIYVYYGLTEASRSTFVNLSNLKVELHTTVGKPMENVKISLEEKSKEIVISGPTVSKGYWPNNLFKTTPEGYSILKTGDIGTFDQLGNLYITGRLKDQINIGGYKVDPLEIERILREMPNIEDIAVVGKRVGSSEEIVYCVVPENPKEINKKEIEDFCRNKIEYYKMPYEVVIFKKLPEGVNGKINRKLIKARLEEGLD